MIMLPSAVRIFLCTRPTDLARASMASRVWSRNASARSS